MNTSPARNKDESFEDYKIRRAANNAANKQACRAVKVLWNTSQQGTYIKAKHGPL